MKFATKKEAVQQWMGEWSHVPAQVVELIGEQEGELNRLTAQEPECGYPVAWSTMFSFKNSLDEEWAEKNIQAFEEVGIVVYDVPYYGIVFGIDGAGYNFYEEHWIPLYEARGLQWHEVEDEGETA